MGEDTEIMQHALHDTDVLLVEDDDATRKTLSHMFHAFGATVHEAGSQMEALGIYVKLYQMRRIPRIVIADWWLVPKSSLEFQALSQVTGGRTISSIMLLEMVCKLDEHAFVTVYTNAPEDATPHVLPLKRELNTVEVVDKSLHHPHEFVLSIVSHEGVIRQRSVRERVLDAMRRKADAERSTQSLRAVVDKTVS